MDSVALISGMNCTDRESKGQVTYVQDLEKST